MNTKDIIHSIEGDAVRLSDHMTDSLEVDGEGEAVHSESLLHAHTLAVSITGRIEDLLKERGLM